jgi:hypothetical protein
MSLHVDSFRESFTFVTPSYFQKSVASTPIPGSTPRRWRFPVAHEGTSVDPGSKSTDLDHLYLFGKRVEIRDLEMEDSSQGVVADHPLVCAHQTVSVSAGLLSTCFHSP